MTACVDTVPVVGCASFDGQTTNVVIHYTYSSTVVPAVPPVVDPVSGAIITPGFPAHVVPVLVQTLYTDAAGNPINVPQGAVIKPGPCCCDDVKPSDYEVIHTCYRDPLTGIVREITLLVLPQPTGNSIFGMEMNGNPIQNFDEAFLISCANACPEPIARGIVTHWGR